MPHSEARAWWADVQHVRESIERAVPAARSSAPLDASDAPAPLDVPERRFTRDAADSLPLMDDLDWTSSLPARSRSRFDHTDPGEGRSRRAVEPRAIRRRRAAGLRCRARGARGSARPPVARAARRPTALRRRPPPRSRRRRPGARSRSPGARSARRRCPRLVEVERRRPARRAAERVGPGPTASRSGPSSSGFFLILVAATSSHAATHAGAARARPRSRCTPPALRTHTATLRAIPTAR